ncbi:MAG TPA: fibronectin/fibrinogen-binding protein [Chloroflexi bacterium]|nr:fibronectin/fibrinogen-binding protein [Chloroflexota bacterium]
MHLDYLTLSCWKQEFNQRLPARIQQIVQVSPLAIGMECYAGERFYLQFSAEPRQPHVLVVPEKARRGVETSPPFVLQMKKLLKGALLTQVSQPPWERILRFHFQQGQETYTLVAELMGRYSNLILLDSGEIILESLKRLTRRLNRFREVLPKRPYQLPPVPAHHLPPEEIDWDYLLARREEGQSLAKLLSGSLLAVSPTLGREIGARSGSEATPQRLEDAFLQVFSCGCQPSLGYDEVNRLVAFAPYPLQQCARSEPAESMNAAILAYQQHGEAMDAYGEARGQVTALLNDALARTRNTIEQMRAQSVSQIQIDRLRENGQLLLTYQFMIEKGMTELTVSDYDDNPRTIVIDPHLSPSENAQAYFTRYDKAQRANEGLPQRLAHEEKTLQWLEQLASDVLVANSRPEIDAVFNALVEGGWVKKERRQRLSQGGPLRVEAGEWLIWVGRSALQNEQVTFKMAAPEDLWLHVHDLPGAHVIIKSGGREVPPAVLAHAARLAAYYSPARKSGGGVQVDVTRRKFVRSIPGAIRGLVTYRESDSLWVEDAQSLE